MKLHVTGLNHRTAPVEVRERIAFDDASLPDALEGLRHCDGVQESMILSTCNRVELVVSAEDQANTAVSVEEFLQRQRSLKAGTLTPHLYHYDDRDAMRHLFRVASSLDSMVLGEPQILGQMKAAYQTAKSRGTLRGFLDTVLTRAFNVAKRVRTETEIGQSAVSVSFAAVELAREIFGELDKCRVLLIGAGKMSELAARHLRRSGVGDVLVTNRTVSRAVEMARIFGGSIVEYSELMSALPEVDIVITSSAAPHYVLTVEAMRTVLQQRRGRPMFLIDIAVPRNVEPEVNRLENVFLYDIDDLGRVVDNNRKGREKEAAQAEAIIAEEVEKLDARLKARELSPLIVSVQERLDKVRREEIERLRGKLGALTPQQEEAIDQLTRGIVNKLAHGPLQEMRRQAGQSDGWRMAEMIRRMFRAESGE